MNMRKISINADACIGCSLCASTYPEAIELDAEGKAVAIAELEDDKADEVIALCPTGAIA